MKPGTALEAGYVGSVPVLPWRTYMRMEPDLLMWDLPVLCPANHTMIRSDKGQEWKLREHVLLTYVCHCLWGLHGAWKPTSSGDFCNEAWRTTHESVTPWFSCFILSCVSKLLILNVLSYLKVCIIFIWLLLIYSESFTELLCCVPFIRLNNSNNNKNWDEKWKKQSVIDLVRGCACRRCCDILKDLLYISLIIHEINYVLSLCSWIYLMKYMWWIIRENPFCCVILHSVQIFVQLLIPVHAYKWR